MRPNRVTSTTVDGRPGPARLLVVLAVLALVVLGLGEVSSAGARAFAAASSYTGTASGDAAADSAPSRTAPADSPADADPAPGSSMDGPEPSLLVRATGPAAAPGPSAPVSALGPGSAPLVAPHLLAQPQSRPPTPSSVTRPAGAPGSRAPPGPAGT